jgi:integrase
MVFKRRLCECGRDYRDATVAKKGNKEAPPACAACGGATRYLPSWYCAVKLPGVDGKLKTHKKSFPTKAKAEAWETEMMSLRNKGEVFEKKDTTFRAAAAIFLKWVDRQEQDNRLAKGTARMYRDKTNTYLIPFFGEMDLKKLDETDIDDYIEARRETPYYTKTKKGVVVKEKFPVNATLNREIATLKRVCSVAVEKKLMRFNPAQDYKLFREGSRERFLSREEVARLLEECKTEHLRFAVVLALNTGLRIDGVLTLRWDEIDFRRNEIVKIVKHHRSKPAKPVRVPLTASLRSELKLRRLKTGGSAFVFPSPVTEDREGNVRGDCHIRPDADIGFKTACKRAGIEDFRFHDLRHTFCTLFLEEFPDKLEVLCEIVGHTSSYMTKKYAHITDRARHEAMANFDIAGGM